MLDSIGNTSISVHMDAPTEQTTMGRVQPLFLPEQHQTSLVHQLQPPELINAIWQRGNHGIDSRVQKMPISTRTLPDIQAGAAIVAADAVAATGETPKPRQAWHPTAADAMERDLKRLGALLNEQRVLLEKSNEEQELPPELPPAPTTPDALRKHVLACNETPEVAEYQQQQDQSQRLPHTLSLDHDQQQLLLPDAQTRPTSSAMQETAGKVIAKLEDVSTRFGGVAALHGASALDGLDQEQLRKIIIGFFALFFVGATCLFISAAICQDRTCMPSRRRY